MTDISFGRRAALSCTTRGGFCHQSGQYLAPTGPWSRRWPSPHHYHPSGLHVRNTFISSPFPAALGLCILNSFRLPRGLLVLAVVPVVGFCGEYDVSSAISWGTHVETWGWRNLKTVKNGWDKKTLGFLTYSSTVSIHSIKYSLKSFSLIKWLIKELSKIFPMVRELRGKGHWVYNFLHTYQVKLRKPSNLYFLGLWAPSMSSSIKGLLT